MKGILLPGITQQEMEIFDWFEDMAYDQCSVNVLLQNQDNENNDNGNIDTDCLYLDGWGGSSRFGIFLEF